MKTQALLMVTILAGGTAAAQKPAATFWIAPSAHKVMRDEAAPDRAPRRIDVAAACNEWAAAQIVLRPDSATKLTGFSVCELRGRGDARIPSGHVRVYQAAYIYLPEHKKDFPDPLPPLTTPLALPAGQCQPLWVSIYVPEGTPAGEYSGEVTLTLEPGGTLRVPIKLRVWGFSIPVKPSMRTAFGISEGHIAQQHGVMEGGFQHRLLLAKYWEMLVSHRISPYTIPADILSPDADRYLGDPRLTSFIIRYSDDEAQLRKTVESLRARGFLDKGYFYVVDEPINEDAYARLTEVCDRIHKIDPKLKIVAPYYRDPDFDKTKTIYDLMPGKINIWCPVTAYYKPEPVHARQKLGEEAWWYVCCGPGAPYANMFVDMPGTAHRVLMWQQKKEGVQGLLYWSTTWWNPSSTKDPWTDIATVKDINPAVYGDGSLMYPGSKVGIDGPVTSIRLELAREGMQDYEYLTLYQKLFGEAKTQQIIGRVTKSMTEFTTDPAVLESARRDMARAIDRRLAER